MRDFAPAYAPARYALLVIAAALVAALLPVASSRAQEPGPPSRSQVTALGGTIESLVQSRDFVAIADLFDAREVTCPGDPVYRAQACDGLADGTVVSAYHIGLMNSEPGVVDRAGLEAFLGEYLDPLPAASATLQTIALRGFGDCPTCGLIVLAGEGGTSAPRLLFVFQVTAAGRVFSAIGGLVPADGGAILAGGTWSGIAFIDPDAAVPAPPDTGSGIAPERALPLPLLAALAAGTFCLAFMTCVVWRARAARAAEALAD